MPFQSTEHFRPIEELDVPYDAGQVQDRVLRRRRRMRGRLISLVITALILVAIYFWQRDQLSMRSFLTLYSVVLGISLIWFLVYLVRYLRAKRELSRVGTGTALRIGRRGVELCGTFVSWPEVQSLRATKARIGRSPALQLIRTSGDPLQVPLDHMDVRPATLDLTARAYSAGRHGVDLEALDS